MPKERRNLKEYQKESMKQVFTAIQDGEDTAYIGVGSIGKSNFLRTMCEAEVMKSHLPNPHHYILVYVDSHLLQHDGEFIAKAGKAFPGYELLLSSLLERIKEMNFSGQWQYPADEAVRRAMLELLERDYHNLCTNCKGDSYAGLRYLKDSCDMFLGEYEDLHIVFLLDEIERFFKYLPVYFFEQMRGLRDKFKRQLMFITTSRYLMVELCSGYEDPADQEIIEGFADLFKGKEYPIKRLDEASAKNNIERYRARYRFPPLSPVLIELLWQASGGHAGLLRHSFQPAMKYPLMNVGADEQLSNFCEYLIKNEDDQGVVDECRTIFESLSSQEQQALIGQTRDRAAFQQVAKSISKKQIVYKHNEGYKALPLFESYLRIYHKRQ